MKKPGTHKLTEAMEGKAPASGPPAGQQPGPPELKGHGSTPSEVAEDTRRAQDARPDAAGDRDDRLTQIGRGHQTHG
jgi:hypothetical protein